MYEVDLDAVERRVDDDRREADGPVASVRIPAFRLGEVTPFTREDLYGERGS